MKATETRIDTFMATNKTTFAIPVYQRNYDWGHTHCKRLLDDIIVAGQSDHGPGHFIGSIVFVHDDIYTPSDLHELTIIDGQQRLTTLTLIYAVLSRHAKRSGRTHLAEEFHETYLINKFVPESEKLKLKPTENNRAALQYVLDDRTDEFPEYSRIIENFNFFKGKINDANFEFVRKGIGKLILVEISLDRHRDNPQRIFESLNSTGLDLSQADLIRNYILMGLSRKNQEKIYTRYWEGIERNARDAVSNESRVSEFIRDYLTLKNREIPTKKYVYATFKDCFPTATMEELEPILAELKSLSQCYDKLLNPFHEQDRETSKHLAYIRQLEINVAYPFLMQVYEDYARELIDKTMFIDVLRLVQSYAWRRFIVGLPTNALNKVFMNLYEKIDPSDYLHSIQKSLLQRVGAARFPTDREIEAALKEKDVYNIQSKNSAYLFERLENHRNNEPILIKDNPDITIEHVFPQKPDIAWKQLLETDEYLFIQENYLNTIGNLTLSGNNGKLGNKTFPEKRDMNVDGKEQGYRFSRLWLNRDLKEIMQWNRTEIERRTQRLTKRFLEVWSFPAVPMDLAAVNDEVNIFEADDPTHRRLEYAIFCDQRLEVRTVTDLYVAVAKQLFDLHPETFFNTSLKEKFGLTSTPPRSGNIQYVKLNDTYSCKTTFSSSEKFERLKAALTEFGFEDELTVKYAG